MVEQRREGRFLRSERRSGRRCEKVRGSLFTQKRDERLKLT